MTDGPGRLITADTDRERWVLEMIDAVFDDLGTAGELIKGATHRLGLSTFVMCWPR